jgi:endoglucanase
MKFATRILCCLLIPACTPTAPTGDAACGDVSIHLNQVGFLPEAAKRAVIAARQETPLRWELVDAGDNVLADGNSVVYGDDPLSGKHLHRVDFSEIDEAGKGLRIVSACAESHPFDIGGDVFRQLKYDALRYFYHNRSGVPIMAEHVGGERWARPVAHEKESATCRSGTDDDGNDWPGCDYTLDVTGGWYDAGDHGKYVVNGGISAWTLMNLFERQRIMERNGLGDGGARIPESGNGVDDVLDEARYELEFLLRMQAPVEAVAQVPVGVRRSSANLEFVSIDASGMAHHKIADENWTPLPMPPHLDRERRVLYPVSTAATLNLAATAAQCARIWRELDAAFARRCLSAAERAYAAARRNPQVYFIANFSGSGAYGDGNVSDEFFWAAAELFTTTGDESYRQALRSSRHFAEPLTREPAWPRVAPLGAITLALVPNDLPVREVERQRERLVAAAERFSGEREQTGYYIPYATNRYPWGSNSNILNRGIVLALAYDFTGEARYRDGAVDAMDYLLGRNPLDRSYVSGYGERPFEHPHHRHWAPSLDPELPPPPPGALSGGPNTTAPADEVAQKIAGSCAPQTCWRDDVRAYSLNEVAINWNAPLVWVAAFLDEGAR